MSYYNRGLKLLFKSMTAVARNANPFLLKPFDEKYIDTLLDISYFCINGNEEILGETPIDKFKRYKDGTEWLTIAIWKLENKKEYDTSLRNRIGRLADDTIFKLTKFGNSLLLNSDNFKTILKASRKYSTPIENPHHGWFANAYGQN